VTTPIDLAALRALVEHEDVRPLDDEFWGEGDGHGDCFQPCCATEADGRLARGAVRALPALLDEVERGRAREAYWRARAKANRARLDYETAHRLRAVNVTECKDAVHEAQDIVEAAEAALRALNEEIPR
jgi:hypothetical protein